MKNHITLIILSLISLLSCRQDDESLQTIDQILNIYVKDAQGKDLINPNVPGSYTNLQFFDLLADTDLKPINNFNLEKDIDTTNYLYYEAGAIRLLKDSISTNDKTYYSQFIMRLSKTQDTITTTVNDTIRIEYSWTPKKFQISKMWKSSQLIFTKVEGQPNIVNIVQ